MTTLLEQALQKVLALSPEGQDEVARVMLALAADEGDPESIDQAHLPAILEGLAQVRRGEFATDEEIAAALARFDR